MYAHIVPSDEVSISLQSKLAMSDNVALSDPDTKAKLKLGLFSYPVLQSADILLYRYVGCSSGFTRITIGRATHVPVGHDQVQHLEFARENAKNFNTAHGHFFPEPQTVMCRLAILIAKDHRLILISACETDHVTQGSTCENV